MAWHTMDLGRGAPVYRVWCGTCGQDWTERVAIVGRRVATGAVRPHRVSGFCECGSAIHVVPLGGTLQVEDPLEFAEVADAASQEQRDMVS